MHKATIAGGEKNRNQVHLYQQIIVLIGHLVTLLNGPPKLETCWSSKNKELCEKHILTVATQHD